MASVNADPLCEEDRIYMRVNNIPQGFTLSSVIEKINPSDPDPVMTIDGDLICIERGGDGCAGYILNTILSAS